MEYLFGNNQKEKGLQATIFQSTKKVDSISSSDIKPLLNSNKNPIENLKEPNIKREYMECALFDSGIIINWGCPKSEWLIKGHVLSITVDHEKSIKSYFCTRANNEVHFYMTTGHTFVLCYDENDDKIIIKNLVGGGSISQKYKLATQ